ncbi:beta strand repeat-containing protein, partial [Campylobacter jejuni]
LNSEIKTYDEVNKNTKARSASVYSPQARVNTTVSDSNSNTINITDQGPHTIIIEADGTLGNNGNKNKIIYAHASGSNTLTLTNLTNKGTINGSVNVEHDNNFNGTITVNTFENTGQVNGQIYMGIWGSNSGTLNIDNFKNSGTIVDGSKGVFFEGKNTHIKTFTNSGTIQGGEVGVAINAKIDTFTNDGYIYSPGDGEWNNGIWISGNATIENLVNNGKIEGGNTAITVESQHVKTITNTGIIHANGGYAAGILISSGGHIEHIINTGTISGNNVGIGAVHGVFGTLTIKDGGIVQGKGSGITVGQWQTLGELYIDGASSNGTVSGIYGGNSGIALDVGSKTSKIELSNGGVIKGNVHGIRLEEAASLSGDMILSGEGSRVEGGSGSGIANNSGKITGSMTIKDGATVTSSSGQAISNSGSGSITGGITVSGENTKLEGNIINTGNGSIGSDIKIEGGAKVEGGLVNQGNGSISGSVQVSGGSTINSITNTGNGAISGSVQVSDGSSIESITNEGSGSISGSITVDKNSKLDSITNTSNSNTGISGSIINNSNNNLEISNSGNIGGKIESTGSADMVISNSNGGTISGGISSSGSGNTSISNSQGSTINNGITVSGSAQVEISNQGSVGKDENGNTVTNNGSGSVGIKDWVVSTDK